ncbi:MAG: S8 family serine peptidase [Sphingomonas sp.]
MNRIIRLDGGQHGELPKPQRWIAARLTALGTLVALCLFGLAMLLPAPLHAQRADPVASSRQQILVLLRLPPPHYRLRGGYGGAGYGDDPAHGARRRLAARIAHDHGLALVTDWPMPLLGLDCYVMAVPDGRSTEAVAALVSKDPGVDWAEPMHVYRTQGAAPAAQGSGDPLFAVQPAARQWRLAELHQLFTGKGVTVAVIDSRIEANHPDLAGQISLSADFAAGGPAGAELHGTGVAGVIAARADNGVGIVGVAPRTRLMALRACWQLAPQPPATAATVCDSLSLAKALHFAIEHNAQVINMSLSGPQDRLLGRLIQIALGRGEVVVGAFDRAVPGGGFPASWPGVIAVSDEATNAAGVYTAPGRDVMTTQPGGHWYLVNGGSYAAAHVSGLVALLREKRKADGRAALVSSRVGGGAIDACATLLGPSLRCDCNCALVAARR